MNKIIFLCLLFSFGAIAQESMIIVTPDRPLDCMQADHSRVNYVYQVNRVSETAQEVVFEFKTEHGFCNNKKFHAIIIDGERASAGTIQTRFLWPWQKEGVSTELTQVSSTVMNIRLILDKTVLFKKRDYSKLSLQFRPGEILGYQNVNGMAVPYYLYYPWTVEALLYDEEGDTELKFVGK